MSITYRIHRIKYPNAWIAYITKNNEEPSSERNNRDSIPTNCELYVGNTGQFENEESAIEALEIEAGKKGFRTEKLDNDWIEIDTSLII